jgi:hypothetical protein
MNFQMVCSIENDIDLIVESFDQVYNIIVGAELPNFPPQLLNSLALMINELKTANGYICAFL